MSSPGGTMMQVTPGFVIAVGAIFPVLCIITLALRFHTRRLQKAKLMIDDISLLPALAFMIGMGICLVVGAQGKALGYPTPLPKSEGVETVITYTSHEGILTQKIEFAFGLMQVLALGLIKLSVLFFYRRIFCIIQGGAFDSVNKIMIAITITWTISFFFSNIFSCGTAFYALWGSIKNTLLYCNHNLRMQNGFAISDFILDIIVLVLPIPKIWSLHISFSQKFFVSVVFLLGGAALAASFMRMYIFIIAFNAGFANTIDPDLEITDMLYWCMIEAGMAFIAANLPTLRFLARTWSWHAFSKFIRRVVSPHPRHSSSRDGDLRSFPEHVPSGHLPRTGVAEMHAVRDFEGQKGMLMGVITVRRDIEQAGSRLSY